MAHHWKKQIQLGKVYLAPKSGLIGSSGWNIAMCITPQGQEGVTCVQNYWHTHKQIYNHCQDAGHTIRKCCYLASRQSLAKAAWCMVL